MFCPKCGSQLEEGTKVCNACGTQITNDNANSQGTANFNQAGGAQPSQNAAGGYQYSGPGVPIKTGVGFSPFDLIVLLGSVVMIIACFLPYASVTVLDYTESVSLFDGKDGYIFTGVAVLVIVFTLIKKWAPQFSLSIVGAALTFYEISDTSEKLDGLEDMIDHGLGFYLLIISAVLMVGGTLLRKFINK